MVSHIRGKIQPSYALSETQALSCPSHLTPPLPPLNALLTLTGTPSLGAAWITPPLVQMSETGQVQSFKPDGQGLLCSHRPFTLSILFCHIDLEFSHRDVRLFYSPVYNFLSLHFGKASSFCLFSVPSATSFICHCTVLSEELGCLTVLLLTFLFMPSLSKGLNDSLHVTLWTPHLPGHRYPDTLV